MKLIKTLAILLAATFTFTSCIEMKEKIVFNKKGGGTYTMTMNMTEMVNLINSMEEEKGSDPSMSEGAKEFAQGFADSMKDIDTKISAVEGITNVQKISNEAEYTFGYSFDFESTEALNNVMLTMSDDAESVEGLFIYGKKGFTRTGNNSFTEQLKNELGGMSEKMPPMPPAENEIEIDEESIAEENDSTNIGEDEMADAMGEAFGKLFESMQNLSLTTEYVFPRKVKNTTSDYEVTLVDKKTVVQKMEFFKEENKDKKTGLVVEF